MQSILDGEVFDIAEPSVDPAQSVVRITLGLHSRLPGKACPLRRLDDEPRELLAPPAIEAVGLGIFVDQAFELACVAGQRGAHKRRREMADSNAGDAPLRLRSLAGIADNEGIDDG